MFSFSKKFLRLRKEKHSYSQTYEIRNLTAIAGIAVAVQRTCALGLGTGRVLVQEIIFSVRWRMIVVHRTVVVMRWIVMVVVIVIHGRPRSPE